MQNQQHWLFKEYKSGIAILSLKIFTIYAVVAIQISLYYWKNVKINRATVFEGYNSINNHSELTGSVLGRGSYIANNSTIRNREP